MPSFDVIISGKTYRVEIPDPGESPLTVIVDGEAFDVTIVGSEAHAAPARPAALPRPPADLGTAPTLPAVRVTRPVAPVGSEASAEVVAPMPGTILSVVVAVGDQVGPGAVLCVLEAMKMKNPIRSASAGEVLEIHVRPGQSVAYGDLLLRLKQGTL